MSARRPSGSRNFAISVAVVLLLTGSALLFAWTHSSLVHEDLSSRLRLRSDSLQRQLDMMVNRKADRDASSRLEEISDVGSRRFKKAREESYRYHARYWLETKPDWPKSPLPVLDKFVSFEPWNGGFNNIRMSLEMAAAMAMALGRTLVLPPKYKMYLRGESSFQDYFDYEDLSKGLSVISYEEFRKIVKLGDVDGYGDAGPGGSSMPLYFKGLTKMPQAVIFDEKSEVLRGLIGSQLMFCFPRRPSKENVLAYEWFDKSRYRLHAIDIDSLPALFETPKVIHFSPILLGHFYTMVWFEDPRIGAHIKRVVRDHIHFGEDVFKFAERIIAELGGDFSFSCLHVRRNDFQFKEVWTPADQIVTNVGPLFNPGETIYIATDELSVDVKIKNKNWNDPLAMSNVASEYAWFAPIFEKWGGREKVKFWGDYYKKLKMDVDVKKILIGSVESVVCSRARVFVGTRKSTFSGYIHRLRGYMNDVGQKEMFDAQARFPIDYFQALEGPSWSRFPHAAYGGGHPYWGREYKEAWEGVYNPLY